MAHEIVNDSYRLDLALVHPPYLIAIAAIYIACNFQEKDYRTWFKKLNVEHEQVQMHAGAAEATHGGPNLRLGVRCMHGPSSRRLRLRLLITPSHCCPSVCSA